MKEYVRKDCDKAQFNEIQMILTITTFLPMKLGMVAIIGAYLKTRPIKRKI